MLGLDINGACALYADTVTNRLLHRPVTLSTGQPLAHNDKWAVTLRKHYAHVYAGMHKPASTFFTRTELLKIHKQFAHPSAQRLNKLVGQEYQSEVPSNTLVESRRDPRQRIRNAPLRFRVSLGTEDVRFNEGVYMDIMFLDGKPALYLVDEATRFSTAGFLQNVTTEDIKDSILLCWSNIYVGLLHTFIVNHGSQFRKTFSDIATMMDVKLQHAGAEAHHSLNFGERLYQLLRTAYHKRRIGSRNRSPKVILSKATEALNDTIGPKGAIPSALVFGRYPCYENEIELL